jgi:hypothetical protein
MPAVEADDDRQSPRFRDSRGQVLDQRMRRSNDDSAVHASGPRAYDAAKPGRTEFERMFEPLAELL